MSGAGGGLTGGGTSGAVELAIAPPLVFALGSSLALMDLDEPRHAARRSRGIRLAASHRLLPHARSQRGPALRADSSAGNLGNAVTAYSRGAEGHASRRRSERGQQRLGALRPHRRRGGGHRRGDAGPRQQADALYARTQSTDPTRTRGTSRGTCTSGACSPSSAGSFRIDNPLDPANEYLQHSFVESPDMKNIYDGVVRTDGRGYATVRLPHWFQALNQKFRYQLTTIRSFSRAMVWREVQAQQLRDPHRRPQVQVSWQVTGDPARRLRAGASHRGGRRRRPGRTAGASSRRASSAGPRASRSPADERSVPGRRHDAVRDAVRQSW